MASPGGWRVSRVTRFPAQVLKQNKTKQKQRGSSAGCFFISFFDERMRKGTAVLVSVEKFSKKCVNPRSVEYENHILIVLSITSLIFPFFNILTSFLFLFFVSIITFLTKLSPLLHSPRTQVGLLFPVKSFIGPVTLVLCLNN